jgi:hypothetical protein
MPLLDNPPGGYRFLTGIAPYSSGVVAAPGYAIVRATLRQSLPYRQGFDRIERHLASLGRPRAALCGVELRSPRPWSFVGFGEFNAGYEQLLDEWDLLVGGQNPVARTNVAPAVAAPDEPALYAFSYTVPASNGAPPPTFVSAGAGELPEGVLEERAIVRTGETSAEALLAKAGFVVDLLRSRVAGLEASWEAITVLDLYTIHPPQPFLESTILASLGPAAIHGLHWYFSRPPIEGLEVELDVRAVWQELWI